MISRAVPVCVVQLWAVYGGALVHVLLLLQAQGLSALQQARMLLSLQHSLRQHHPAVFGCASAVFGGAAWAIVHVVLVACICVPPCSVPVVVSLFCGVSGVLWMVGVSIITTNCWQ